MFYYGVGENGAGWWVFKGKGTTHRGLRLPWGSTTTLAIPATEWGIFCQFMPPVGKSGAGWWTPNEEGSTNGGPRLQRSVYLRMFQPHHNRVYTAVTNW